MGIIEKCEDGERLEKGEIASLLTEAPLTTLGMLAHRRRMQAADPEVVTYVVDRNINYTNVCTSGCRFCAFFRPPGHAEGYVVPLDELGRKIEEAVQLGACQILIQGGLHPELKLDYYVELLGFIKSNYRIHVHGFSPPEVVHIARHEGLSFERTIQSLRKAGLDSIPGGGAEVLTDRSRERVSPGKCTAREWLEVMRAAHGLGMKTTATMMFGHGETVEERVEHLLAVRALQDETGGFTAFIPWTFQPGNTRLADVEPLGGHEYLKMLAVSRLALDNFRNLQLSWVTQGARVGQTALFFGANDFGSTMIEENVVAAAGVSFRMDSGTIEQLIRSAGFEPKRRNQAYEILEDDPRGSS
jgi:cyclic dehypoxanthinyl futalosine synthase